MARFVAAVGLTRPLRTPRSSGCIKRYHVPIIVLGAALLKRHSAAHFYAARGKLMSRKGTVRAFHIVPSWFQRGEKIQASLEQAMLLN